MASHQQTAAKRALLGEEIRRDCLSGALVPGQMLPPLARLSEKYALSHGVVHQELQKLVAAGLLYSVPRTGIFVGRPPSIAPLPYVLLSRLPRGNHLYVDQMMSGFEEQIAHLGGATHSLAVPQVQTLLDADHPLPGIAGLFLFSHLQEPAARYWSAAGVPSVVFGRNLEADSGPAGPPDEVDFDNEDGGRQATRRLLDMGHRHIAFLGVHAQGQNIPSYEFSCERATGWSAMLHEAGLEAAALLLSKQSAMSLQREAQIQRIKVAAAQLAQFPRVTAVVAANSYAVEGLLQHLIGSGLPREQWPAIVGFDDTPGVAAAGVSYLRLPWEKVGAEAANLLWGRHEGRITGPPQRRLVQMRLIRRLSCTTSWVTSSGFHPDVSHTATQLFLEKNYV